MGDGAPVESEASVCVAIEGYLVFKSAHPGQGKIRAVLSQRVRKGGARKRAIEFLEGAVSRPGLKNVVVCRWCVGKVQRMLSPA